MLSAKQLVVSNCFTAFRTLRQGVVRVEAKLNDFVFPSHSHKHVCIGVVRDGEHDCRYGIRRYTVEKGDLMLVNAGEVHDGRPSGRCGRRYCMLEINPAAFKSLCLDVFGEDPIEFQTPVVRQANARGALAVWLARLSGDDAPGECEAAALLLGCLSAVKRRTVSPACQSELAARVSRRIGECPFTDSVGELAMEMGVSRYKLIRAFKQKFGLTPEDFRRQSRVERARTMLAGNRGLADIALAAGFADQSHMTREFRRVAGLSPGAYRRGLE